MYLVERRPTRPDATSRRTQSSLAAVAEGMSVERYRRLLLELYQHRLALQPDLCRGRKPRFRTSTREVRYFLYRHMHEESGHEAMGGERPSRPIGVYRRRPCGAHPPSRHVLALNGYNYWAADRAHPCSILGMMYVLEVIASVYGGPFATADDANRCFCSRRPWRVVHQLACHDGH